MSHPTINPTDETFTVTVECDNCGGEDTRRFTRGVRVEERGSVIEVIDTDAFSGASVLDCGTCSIRDTLSIVNRSPIQ